ncbi:hypothetical protein BJ508DRAFT_305424 [Ascobolus immersus RN42]|uniref:SURP motif domain-containing protein n=1 Tax=Ascobolus immersus RN42 TaxID=1160509 RepID=A0A3N4IAQ1_ASCIM|nr:hypothetical protein BJ508DRAFT_305424 [Ascobolus immersus RN42]
MSYPTLQLREAVIIPPTDIKANIEKTIFQILRCGAAFEEYLRQQHADEIVFSFLKPGNAYHLYYRLRFREILRLLELETAQQAPEESMPTWTEEDTQSEPEAPVAASSLPEQSPIPPDDPEYKDQIEKAAVFVAIYGPEFETRMLNHRPALNVPFLQTWGADHAYYQWILHRMRNFAPRSRNRIALLKQICERRWPSPAVANRSFAFDDSASRPTFRFVVVGRDALRLAMFEDEDEDEC